MKTLDCRNMQCPRPVLETRKQLLAHPTQAITVLVDNDVAQANVTRLAHKEGFDVVAATEDQHLRLTLTPTGSLSETTVLPATSVAAPQTDTVVYIASNCMGRGSDELGEVLMRNFIFTLAETSTPPTAILFVNSGVKLTCQGSAVLEPLRHLAAAGVTIGSCGLCLEFFGLKEQLQIGQISNMLETVEALQQATRIIQP